MRESFFVKTKWKEKIDELPDEQAGMLIMALCRYFFDGTVPEFDNGILSDSDVARLVCYFDEITLENEDAEK